MSGDSFARVEIDSRAAWRQWLTHHHRQGESIWLVTWKKGRGPFVPYADVRDEALCFGWIDSLPRKLDDDRTMHLLSPRRPGSGWSAVNKARIEELEAMGLMTEAGRARIEAAKADGSWNALDGAATTPADLQAVLAAVPKAAASFAAFSPSSRRGILEWIVAAQRPETRERRIAETARLAALGLRANFPESRGA